MAARYPSMCKAPGWGIFSITTTALAFLIGVCATTPALAGVTLTAFSVWSSDPVSDYSAGAAPSAPEGKTVPVSLDATTTSNPLPAISEAIEYDKLIRSQTATGPLDSSLLGESVDYYTGQTDFVATDVSLPGNFAIPVSVGRRYHVTNHAGGILTGAFGDWDLDVPHVEGVVASNVGWTVPGGVIDARCSYFGAPPNATVTTTTQSNGTVSTTVPSAEYNTGFTAVIPGLGRHELLLRENATPAPSGTHPVTTKELWAISCVQLIGAAPGSIDEGFVVTTPNGITYTFNQGYTRPYAPLQRPADTTDTSVVATVDREQVWMLPSKVQDRYGNTVTYSYAFSGGSVVLKSIAASDGRQITLTYAYQGSKVQSITDGTHKWNYTYGYYGDLQQVTLPDSSRWTIDFGDLNQAQWMYSHPTCSTLPSPTTTFGSAVSGTIQHPSGALGTFTFGAHRFGRSGAPTTCLANSAGVTFAPTEPSVYDVLSMAKKEVVGPALGTLTWNLAYAGCSSTSCGSTVTTTLTDPRNYTTRYTFGAQYGTNGSGNEGMLLNKQSGGNSGVYPRSEQYTYFDASGNPYPSVLGTPAQARGDVSQLSSLRPMSTRTITQDGATFTQTRSKPDGYGFPQNITRVGTDTKTDTLTYSHNTTDWVLGTVQKLTSNASDEIKLTLDSHSRPTQVYRFGRLDSTIDYYADGPVKTITDGNTHTTTFTNYTRGIPRNISHANGDSESVAVSPLGLITSHTDGAGRITGYGYDSMRRLSIIMPSGGYNATSITWNTYTDTCCGWTRTTKTGTATTTDTYDGFLRSVKTVDTGGRTVNRTFDADGNPLFVSYPAGGTYGGTTSAFDGLDRIESQSDGDGRYTHISYTANEVSVQNRNGRYTNTTYKAYDDPTTAWPTYIQSPIASTTIDRDPWGKPTSIIRSASLGGFLTSTVKRELGYYATQLLHTLDDPETGTTTFSYDAAANVTTIDHNGTGIETRSYDARNRLTDISYSSGDPAVSLGWYGDNQPHTAGRGGNTRTYGYDGGGLLTSESIAINGTLYALSYGYDLNQHLSSLTYPDNTSITLVPDAFGRPSQVGTYAIGVSYYPNDAVNTFTYGNGISHSMTQDDRQLPQIVSDSGISHATIGYDGDGNPTSISDSVNAAHSRSMTYDTGDRLKTASGPWGSSMFTLDGQDNLTGDTSPPGISLSVDSNNQLTGYSYDGRGNQRSAPTVAGRPAMTYTFNTANLLTKIVQGANTWSYTYDASGTRGSAAGPSGTMISVYGQGGQLLYEAKTTNAVADRVFADGFEVLVLPTTTTKYIYLGNHLVAKAATNGATTQVTYLHTDALGTPVAQTNASRGVVGTAAYTPFGSPWSSSGTAIVAGPGYASQYGDATGLIYMHARYYDPILRRFISPDPNSVDPNTAQNFNRYAYANNSPFRFYDPSGRCASSDMPDATDDGQPCAGQEQSSAIKDTLDAVDSTLAAMGPIGMEVSSVERAGVAAAKEVAAAVPSVIEDVKVGVAAFEEATTATTVIGKLRDLETLAPGEQTLLDRLPNLGSPKANWIQNSGVLRQEMSLGQPIRDASVDGAGALINNTGFLRAERYLLQDREWIYDPTMTMWYPPEP